MPRPFPPEFRQKAVELARERAKPIREIAGDLGIAESCLRRWMAQDDIDAGRKEGLTRVTFRNHPPQRRGRLGYDISAWAHVASGPGPPARRLLLPQ